MIEQKTYTVDDADELRRTTEDLVIFVRIHL
eukprot:COSAG02_NODE_46019_length_352_cov_0.988142_1_plen_30_part_01